MFWVQNALYAKDLLPALADKTAEEIEIMIKSWYDEEITIDEIVKEIYDYKDYTTFEELCAGENEIFGATQEQDYLISKEQFMIVLASKVYTLTHPVVIEYPNGTSEELDWWQDEQVSSWSYIITNTGTQTIKVTSPNGYIVPITITLDKETL